MFRPLLLIAALTLPGTAFAQAAQCNAPASFPRPGAELPDAGQPQRLVPVGGYTLALSWSPEYCAAPANRSDYQCTGRNGRFGFVLHGLWPDGRGKDWPQYCRAAQLLPTEVIRQNLCTTPSPQLLQHEWAKHGTCMTTRPEQYFNASRTLYRDIRYPDMTALATRPTLTVGAFTSAFVAQNPGLRAEMVRVQLNRKGWLEELWLCMDRNVAYARCPSGKPGAAASARMRVAPGPRFPRQAPAPVATRRPGFDLRLDPEAAGRERPEQ
jgi:ribonuclease T2